MPGPKDSRAPAPAAVAIVVGAGEGHRLGDPSASPKGLRRVAGRSLIEWAARALAASEHVVAVQAVIPPDVKADSVLAAPWDAPARWLDPVPGGETRQDSVERGLQAALRAGVSDFVLVHDAARCLVSAADADAVLAAAAVTGAALPVVPLADSVKRTDGERVLETVDRTALALAQTPQAFRAELLAEALEKAARDGFAGTDCAALVERLGVEVRVSPGRRENWKVTWPGDLERAAQVLEQRR